MDNKEAIKNIKEHCYFANLLPQAKEALDMAIQVLEQEPRKDDENELKFYYVESIDDYWIGQRIGNFYYASWDEDVGFVWSHSRYLPWGEHIVNENSLWKEHTYPSEPAEIPFTEWIVGFMKKYSTEPKTGYWIKYGIPRCEEQHYQCTSCEYYINFGRWGEFYAREFKYCPHCGAEMKRRMKDE